MPKYREESCEQIDIISASSPLNVQQTVKLNENLGAMCSSTLAVTPEYITVFQRKTNKIHQLNFNGSLQKTLEIKPHGAATSDRRLCALDTNGCLVLTEGGQLVVQVNDDSSQVVKLPGVTNISDLVFEDPCAFWVLTCTDPEEGAYSLIKFVT